MVEIATKRHLSRSGKRYIFTYCIAVQPFQKIIRAVLHEDYSGCLLGRNCLILLPLAPPNLRSLDFIFWTNIKSELHENAGPTLMDTDF
jgi:hypothetical protein